MSFAASIARGVQGSLCLLHAAMRQQGIDIVVLVPLQTSCSFAGAWGGGQLPKAFYVSSYIWDRALEAGGLTSSVGFSLACKLCSLAGKGAV